MKKYIIGLLLGFLIFLSGMTFFWIETMNYKYDNSLTDIFPLKTEEFMIKIEMNKKYRITNYQSDNNLVLKIDNTLKDEIKVINSHVDTAKIHYSNNTTKNIDEDIVNLRFSSSLDLDFDDIKPIFDLTAHGFKNRTIYDYSILKYSTIEVYVNEINADKIEFMKKNGDIYSPFKTGEQHGSMQNRE